MARAEIELKTIKSAVNAILDHLVEDLHIERMQVDEIQLSRIRII